MVADSLQGIGEINGCFEKAFYCSPATVKMKQIFKERGLTLRLIFSIFKRVDDVAILLEKT